MTRHETRFRKLVRALVVRGIFPSPTVINREIGRTTRAMNVINGPETRWRTEELLALGYGQPLLAATNYVHPDADMPTPASNRKMQREGESLVCTTEFGYGEIWAAILLKELEESL